MILSSSGAVAVSLFGFDIYWYGIFLGLAILFGTLVADYYYRNFFSGQEDKDLIFDVIPSLLLVGVLGARIYYCCLNGGYYFEHPIEILNIRQGGLSIHGMFISCAIFLLLFVRIKKIKFFNLTAPLLLGVAIGQAIGRWGNFFNSEAFGKPYDGFIKLYIAPQFRPEEYLLNDYFHPTFLYESILCIFVFCVLFIVVMQKRYSPLFVTSLYFLLYGLVRFCVEFVRIDSLVFVFGIPIAAFVSILIIVLGIIGFLLDLKKKFR